MTRTDDFNESGSRVYMMEVEFVRGRIAGCHDNHRVIIRDREFVSLISYRTYTKEQCPVG